MRIFQKFFFNLTKSRNPKKRLFWLFFFGSEAELRTKYELQKVILQPRKVKKGLVFCWFLFPGARLNKSWMSRSTRLFQHLTRIALSNSRKQ